VTARVWGAEPNTEGGGGTAGESNEEARDDGARMRCGGDEVWRCGG
jgi:hypothetical protein